MKWLEVKNQIEGATEIFINGNIKSDTENSGFLQAIGLKDPSIYPLEFKKAMDEATGDLHVHINCGGGNAFAGIAMGNMIKQYKKGKTIAYVDGVAASAASVIALSCDEVNIPGNAFLMIHKVAGAVEGNANDLQKAIETFDRIEEGVITGYMEKAKDGVTREDIQNYMEQETWFTGELAGQVFNVNVEAPNGAMNYAAIDGAKKVPTTLLKAQEKAGAISKAKLEEQKKEEQQKKMRMELELALAISI